MTAADVQGVAALPAVREAVESAGFETRDFEVSAFRSGRLDEG